MTMIKTRHYSTTILLSPSYSIGFGASLVIVIQIITGYILSSNYIASTSDSFDQIHNTVMRELDSGWLLRYNHMSGCNVLFVLVYGHMIRGMCYNSISKTYVWLLGVIIYIFLCGISFTGYSLVYGQMSLWAIVVITSLVTAIPLIGNKILVILWGGSVISTNTIQRLFAIHYLLPICLILLIIMHLVTLHMLNSSGYINFILIRLDRVNLYPLLLIRDLVLTSILLNLYLLSPIYAHSDNYIPANQLVTPTHIMPEFYLLPFYALIRSIPHKLIGITMMILVISCISNLSLQLRVNHYILENNHLSITLVIDIVFASILCLLI